LALLIEAAAGDDHFPADDVVGDIAKKTVGPAVQGEYQQVFG
jgi:hypothetical protein